VTPTDALALITYTAEKWGAAAALPTDEGVLSIRVQVWVDALGDLDAGAVRAVLAEAPEEFPPNVAVIRRRVDAKLGVAPDIPAWDVFWSWVRDEASHATLYLYDDAPEFVCPWPEMAGVVTLSQILQWARDGQSAHDLEMIQQAHVRRTYEARAHRIEKEAPSEMPVVAAWRETPVGDLVAGAATAMEARMKELEA
jgi:hypothetical protein